MIGQVQIVDAAQFDPSHWGDWGDYGIKLLGAGGVGILLREVVKQIFARASQQDENRRTTRADQATQIATLVARVDVLDARVEAERQRSNQLFAANAELRAENIGLRQRYHRLLSWLSAQPGLPSPPSWLYETVDGPTRSSAMPQSPEGG
jgi:hypothetical protein